MAAANERPGAAGSVNPGGAGIFLLAVALVAAVFVLTLLAYRPPAPRGADAPEETFSAARAKDILAVVLGEGAPRPVGSEADARARRRIAESLAGMGYETEEQATLACREQWGNCATVHNLLARRPGDGGGPAVLLVAHHDSVGCGPGASDDGSGVATLLEVARALAATPPALNPVRFLFVDGEEGGLLGAQGFVDEHPGLEEVGVVLNFDARGTHGPSLMFETSPETAWLLGHFAAAATRPITSSAFYTIYQQLPNNTDFTVFREAGVKGYNFAFVHGVEHYHRPSDTLENLSAATLQHQGNTVLALVRRLAAADLGAVRPGGAVFFDLMCRTVVRWPQGLTLPLAVLTVLLCLAAVALLIKAGALRGAALAWGLGGWPLMVAAAGLGLYLLDLLLKAAGILPPARLYSWIDSPTAEITAYWATAFAVMAAVALLLARRAGAWGTWSGVWLWWAIAGLALGLVLPGVSYLFLLPALAAALLGLGAALAGGSGPLARLAAVVPPVVVAVLWLFLAILLYQGLGTPGLLVTGVLVALMATSLAPPLAAWSGRGWSVPVLALVVVAAAVGVGAASPGFTAETPRPLNLVYLQDGAAGQARWLVFGRAPGDLPASLRQAAEFGNEPVAPFPWVSAPWFFAAPAPAADLPPPELTFTAESTTPDGARRLVGRLRSRRGAPVIRFQLPAAAGIRSLVLDGKEAWSRPPGVEEGDWSAVRYLTLPPEGVEVEVVTDGSGPGELWLVEESFGLPPGGEVLQAARPVWAAPINDGDETLLIRPVALEVTPAEQGGDEAPT